VTITSNPRFRKGDTVVLRATLEPGRVERDPVLDGGEYWYRVRFVKRVENVVEADLDALSEGGETLESLAVSGRWGTMQACRCALAVERITNTNRSTVYAFKAHRILFEPYQYKPLLKVLDSPDRRLLIADEVGLGKTIEAGLVLTELEARRPLDKVLIACPSRLRDKWREELNRKFDQEFDIYDKPMMLDYMDRLRQNPRRSRLRAIISIQTLRNEAFRDQIIAEVGQVDMVVVDEAHHARNPETQTSEMLRDLGSLGDCVLLLTATPLHLGSRDLFTLLNALRPVEFRDASVFERDLHHHRGVIEAGSLVRSRTPEAVRQAVERLTQVFTAGRLRAVLDPLATQLIEEMELSPPQDRRGWIELERRIQDLHPLATILTRTRKRDVQEHAPVRHAKVFLCQWTPEEDEAYQRLVDGASHGWIRERLSFGQIQRARQAASCLPATAEKHLDSPSQTDDDAVELSDIPPSEVEEDVRDQSSQGPPFAPGVWTRRDSKYEKLREILQAVWEEEPTAKVLIFTFFVGTASYLTQRLTNEGFPSLRIAGDVPSNPRRPDLDERGKLMRQFHDDPTIRVLVSTEVGSEGLDFQFCHHLVNYDLPWNPMVVEQRIGRIDRFGQESEVVNIHNLVVEGTVEDCILYRLYDRIGLFRQSIGDLEEVLGETVRELQRDYVSGRLTPEEADARVEQAANAINRRRTQTEELEKRAGELFGHEEYIRDEMARVNRLGRYVSEEAMLAVIRNFLQTSHPSAGIWEERAGVYGIRLTEGLRGDLQDAAQGTQFWMDRSRDDQILITTQGEIAFRNPDVELVNVSHPIVRAAVKALTRQLETPVARVGKATVDLPSGEDTELGAGDYYAVVFAHQVEGIRARRVLETVVWSGASGGLVDPEAGERLLHLGIEQGIEWDSREPAPALPKEAWCVIESEVRRRNRVLLEQERRENEALYARRKRALEAEYTHDREVKETRLRTARARGREERILRAFEGQLRKADSDYRDKVGGLEQMRAVSARLSEPAAACLIRVRRE